MTKTISCLSALLMCGAIIGSAARADTTSAPASTAQPLRYQVQQVDTKARVAAIGADPKSDIGWREIKVGEFLTAGMQINTNIRGGVKLVAVPSDPPTVIMIEHLTTLQISELEYRNGAAHSRLQLGHGAIRAGVAEGQVRSDMEIASPGATLSKKGTDIFRFWYFSPSDWGMSLSERGRGAIQAIQMMESRGGVRTRNVLPGQSVNQMMMRTIDTEVFSRFINVNDLFGLTSGDIKLLALWGNGLGVKGVNGNLIDTRSLTGRDTKTDQNKGLPGMMNNPSVTNGTTLQLQEALNRLFSKNRQQTHTNSGGDFGIGQGSVPTSTFGNTHSTSSTLNASPARGQLKVQALKNVPSRR